MPIAASAIPRAEVDPVHRLIRESLYLLTGFPIALASFVVLVTGLSLSAGLIIIWIGVPLAFLTLIMARGFAALERARLRAAGVDLLGGGYSPSGGSRRSWFSVFGDSQRWLDLVHGVIAMPLATFTWSIALIWWTGAIGGVTFGLWHPLLPPHDSSSLNDLIGWHGAYAESVTNTAIGFVFLISLVPVIRGCLALHAGLGRLLLGNDHVRRLEHRVDALTVSRAAVVEAEAQSLRRLERDIHDGPQQRLVRLGMDLSAAERRLAENPEEARTLLTSARAQTTEALAELRALSRGIAPPILVDRGLAAALAAVAARSTVQADLQVGLPDAPRLPASVENAAYFLVSEALANVAKHSQATHVYVRVLRDRDVVRVEVEDDGVGGAHPAKGHGLQGLADRMAGVDGKLTVTSPPGGPTLVRADIPCA